jgi:hypothetical protein
MKPFIIAAIVICFVTFSIVFNLDNIAGIFDFKYQDYRAKQIYKMKGDHSRSDFWKEKGDGLEGLRPDNGHRTPSEWWIIVYSIRNLLAIMKTALRKEETRVLGV